MNGFHVVVVGSQSDGKGSFFMWFHYHVLLSHIPYRDEPEHRIIHAVAKLTYILDRAALYVACFALYPDSLVI